MSSYLHQQFQATHVFHECLEGLISDSMNSNLKLHHEVLWFFRFDWHFMMYPPVIKHSWLENHRFQYGIHLQKVHFPASYVRLPEGNVDKLKQKRLQSIEVHWQHRHVVGRLRLFWLSRGPMRCLRPSAIAGCLVGSSWMVPAWGWHVDSFETAVQIETWGTPTKWGN